MADDETNSADPTDLNRIAAFVAELSAHMKATGLASLEVDIPEARIRLRSERKQHGATGGGKQQARQTPEVIIVDEPGAEPPDTSGDEAYVFAPMIGTFYAAPGPGEPDFVSVGDHVEIGQTIAIIEAMKIMNEIASDQNGTIAEILVQNADAVEYGQPLFRLIADEA